MAFILLIEDDDDLREEIRDFFTRRRHTVRDVGKLADARRVITERAPDVVVSDINLPDGDGAMFCAEHARRHPRTKWLVMSGDPNAVSRQLKRGPDAPPFSVLSKPVPMRMLDEFVRLAEMAANSGPSRAARAVGDGQ